MARLVWHVDAARDIQLAVEYISRDSLVAAGFFALRITKAAERLTIHPRLGRHVPEITDPSYRELLFQNYRIVYVLTDDKVAIIGVGARSDGHAEAQSRTRVGPHLMATTGPANARVIPP